MKKRKYLALLLTAGMLAQTAFSAGGALQVQAAGNDEYVKVSDLTDNDTEAPKKDGTIPSKNQYEYQKQELAAFVTSVRIRLMRLNGEKVTVIKLRMKSLS